MNDERKITLEKDHLGQWAWFCDACGWAGFGLYTEHAAHREGAQHVCPTDEVGNQKAMMRSVAEAEDRKIRARRSRARPDRVNRRDIAALGGDPSL